MGKLVLTEFVTLDGVIEDPGGGDGSPYGGWAFKFDRGPDGDRFKWDELMAADVMLLGRITYEGFAKAWPTMDAGEFGAKMNGMPKVVVSSTLEHADWSNTTILRGDLREGVEGLKSEYDGDVLVQGSAQLAQALVELDLVDAIRLVVFPVLAGGGRRLFGEASAWRSFTLEEAKQSGETVLLTYSALRS
jgi:dihydrofolate reductase